MTWTDERVELLKKLWELGLSCSQIANRLNDVTEGPHVSRNAVIGKRVRIGLPDRGKSHVNRTKQDMRKGAAASPWALLSTRPKPPVAEDHIVGVDDVARVHSTEDLEREHCRYPVGEPMRGYCGATRVPGASYCAEHLERCYYEHQHKTRRGPGDGRNARSKSKSRNVEKLETVE